MNYLEWDFVEASIIFWASLCYLYLIFFVQILLAVDLALDCKDTQADLWGRICRDEYMAYAVQECYYSIEKILYSIIVDHEGRLWYGFYILLLYDSLCFILHFWVRDGWQIKEICPKWECHVMYLFNLKFLYLLRVQWKTLFETEFLGRHYWSWRE